MTPARAGERRLVVTADDLGLSGPVNDGVLRAHRDGIVTSASLMVHGPAAEDAAARSAGAPALSVGLHLELVSWEVRDGAWCEVARRADPDDAGAVADELAAQLERFERLVGRPPAHLDSHHHVHREGAAAAVVAAAGDRLGVAVRGRGTAYVGDFYGQYGTGHPWPQGITVEALVGVLLGLPAGDAELACHPAGAAHPAHGTYDAERVVELATLCDPRVRDAVAGAGIALVPSSALGGPPGHPKRPDT